MFHNGIIISFFQPINIVYLLLNFIFFNLLMSGFQLEALQMIPILSIKMIIVQYQPQPELIFFYFRFAAAACAAIRSCVLSFNVFKTAPEVVGLHKKLMLIKYSRAGQSINKIYKTKCIFRCILLWFIYYQYLGIRIRKVMSKQIQQPFIKHESEYVSGPSAEPLGFFGQAGLLIYKNFILTFKNPKNIIFLIITPFILALFMKVFGSLAEDNGERTLQEPPLRVIPPFPSCIGKDCVSIEYAVIYSNSKDVAPPWIEQSMNYVRKKTGLPNDTIKGYEGKIATHDELKKYYNNFNLKPNRTQIGLIFCAGPNEQLELNIFCDGSKDYAYYLVINKTDSLSVMFHDILEPMPIDQVSVSLKLIVDNSLYNIAAGKPDSQEMHINYTTSQFPVGHNRYIKDYDIITEIGAFYFMITPLFAFLFIQSEIVREKQYRLRQGLNVFGATHGAYWISWFVIANIYSIITAISTFFAGLAFGFEFFKNTPFYIIIFFVFYPFTLAMQMMSFFLATLSPTLKAANAISYGIVLFAIVVESFVANNNLLVFLFSDDPGALITLLKTILLFYPPFSYTKIFTNISQFSGHHFSIVTRKWEPGPENYSLDVFTRETTGSLKPLSDGGYTRYSDLVSMIILFASGVFFIILTWYFDHVVESNRGRSDSPLFPFKRLINLFKGKDRKRRIIPTGVDQLRSQNFILQNQEESTIRERERVYNNSQSNLPAFGLRIKDLSKTFSQMCSKNRVEAIKNFNLQIEPNELMGILGHNGAGKTTLINILTGVLNPDDTKDLQIIINNKSIDNINEIRKYIGVCSQFDILWGEMTAEDHLYMFARLKNVPKERIDAKIDEILAFVNLKGERKARVQSFSGGMKRRLSLAVAAIGNPKIILLDEPTTGLDPKVRQQIWDLIEKMKKGKSIILTTHSMEEADILADRLSIMVKGKLKCLGTSFYLKQKYGDGHRIALNIDDSKSEEVFKIIKKLFPKAVQVDCKGGNMIIGMNDFQNLLDLIKMLENKEASGLDEFTLKKSIKDWSVSHSTLEEVFMKVTKESHENEH